MWAYFNNQGQCQQKLEHGQHPAAGTTDFGIFAFFGGITDQEVPHGTATIRLYRPDLEDTGYLEMAMSQETRTFELLEGEQSTLFQDGQEYRGFAFDFGSFENESSQEVTVLLDMPGTWRAVITIYDGNGIRSVQGELNFHVADGIDQPDPTEAGPEIVLPTIFDELGRKVNVSDGIYVKVVNGLESAVGEDGKLNPLFFGPGDIIFDKSESRFYKVGSTLVYQEGTNPAEIPLNLHLSGDSRADALNFGSASIYYDSDKNRLVLGSVSDIETLHATRLVGPGGNSILVSYVIQQITNAVSHMNRTDNPHSVTKAQVGLGNVNNTSDANKPLSNAAVSALANKLDKQTATGPYTMAYVKNPNGSQGMAAVDSDFQPGAIVRRDSSGAFQVATGNSINSSVNKGYVDEKDGDLQEQINNLKGRGRYLSVWNPQTGLATTVPETGYPYIYKTGDYFIIGAVTEGATHYKPKGTQYTGEATSDTREQTTEDMKQNDYYQYDGSSWVLIANVQREVAFESIIGDPTDNAALAAELSSKVDYDDVSDESEPSTVAKRTATGTIKSEDPTESDDVVTKNYFDTHSTGSRTYQNPVLDSGSGDRFPDPTVWAGDDGYFYATATSFGKHVFRSANLVDWEDGGYDALTAGAKTTISSAGYSMIWAPQVVRCQGYFLMYVSAIKQSGGVNTETAIYVLRSRTSQGPFYFPIKLVSSEDVGFECIDPFAIQYQETNYLFLGSSGGIHYTKLSPDGMHLAANASFVHVAGQTVEEDPTRATVYEGTMVYRRGKWFYMFVSYGDASSSGYGVKVGRCNWIEGPFVDSEGNDLKEGGGDIILSKISSTGVNGPGHMGEIFVDSNGLTYAFYHCHTSFVDGSNWARPTFLQEIKWDSETDWPYFEDGEPALSGTAPANPRCESQGLSDNRASANGLRDIDFVSSVSVYSNNTSIWGALGDIRFFKSADGSDNGRIVAKTNGDMAILAKGDHFYVYAGSDSSKYISMSAQSLYSSNANFTVGTQSSPIGEVFCSKLNGIQSANIATKDDIHITAEDYIIQ